MKSFVVVIGALAVLIPPALITYVVTPSVYAVRTGQSVTVHFETLEYHSNIRQIEIVEQKTGRTVWLVNAQGEMFQMGSFKLVAGLNMSTLQPSWGRARTEIPAYGSFDLQRGMAYRAYVCFRGWPYVCEGTDFVVGSN
jgi:hypothetical protein